MVGGEVAGSEETETGEMIGKGLDGQIVMTDMREDSEHARAMGVVAGDAMMM